RRTSRWGSGSASWCRRCTGRQTRSARRRMTRSSPARRSRSRKRSNGCASSWRTSSERRPPVSDAKRARPIVLAAPSGTGKTTIAHRLVEGTGEFVFSVSATTRQPRKGERNGMDYEFMTREAFEAMVQRGEFAEWAEVHGNLYGTPRRTLEEATARGEF